MPIGPMVHELMHHDVLDVARRQLGQLRVERDVGRLLVRGPPVPLSLPDVPAVDLDAQDRLPLVEQPLDALMELLTLQTLVQICFQRCPLHHPRG